MKQIKIKIMSEGDQVLNCWDDKIAIRRANGEVDIFQISIGDNNVPILSEEVWRITYGKGNTTIEITSDDIQTKDNHQRQKESGTERRSPSKDYQTSLSEENEEDSEFFEMTVRPKKR